MAEKAENIDHNTEYFKLKNRIFNIQIFHYSILPGWPNSGGIWQS
jgi:hypothetical protein